MSICKRFTRSLAAIIFLWSATAFAVQPLEITEVYFYESVDEISPHQLIITGRNFDNGSPIELWLGEIGAPLEIESMTEHSGYFTIVANLPEDILDGSYQLVATTGGGTVRFNAFDGVTIGAEGLQGPPGADSTVPGPQGDDGSQGDQGEQGIQGIQGEQGLSGEDGAKGDDGSQGDQGEQGIQGDQGDKGDTGNIGPPGPLGLPGPQGEPSADLTGDLCVLYGLTQFSPPDTLDCQPYQCDVPSNCGDGLTCTVDTCDLATGCDNQLIAGNCLIGGQCWTDGTGQGSCRTCDSTANDSGWTNAPSGTNCGFCAVCDAGSCSLAPAGTDPYNDCPYSSTCDGFGSCASEHLTCASPGVVELPFLAVEFLQGPAHVWAFTPYESGSYQFVVDSSILDTTLIIAGDCGDVENSLLGSADEAGSGEALTLELSAGQTVYILVDGYTSTSEGEYELIVDGPL